MVPREQLEASDRARAGRLGCRGGGGGGDGDRRALQEEVAVEDGQGLLDLPDPGVALEAIAGGVGELGGEGAELADGLPRRRDEILVGDELAARVGEERQHPVAALHGRLVGLLHTFHPPFPLPATASKPNHPLH